MGSPDSDTELQEIKDSIRLERADASEPLFQRRYRLPMVLAITIGMFNQLSGINAILYYLNDIFLAAGFSKLSGNMQAVIAGGMNLAATLVGMSLIDKLGRKTLLLIGSIGTAICLSGVAWVFLSNSHQRKSSCDPLARLYRKRLVPGSAWPVVHLSQGLPPVDYFFAEGAGWAGFFAIIMTALSTTA